MKKCFEALREELAARKVDFKLDNFDGTWIKFAMSSCIGDQRHYAALRATFFAVMCVVTAWSVVDAFVADVLTCWPIYLTHWSLLVVDVYLYLAARTTAAAAAGRDGRTPWYCKIAWMLQCVALPASFFVVVGYWSFVYDYSDTTPLLISLCTHGLNFVIVAGDVALSAQPYYIVHSVFFLAYLYVYLAWTVLHYFLGLKDCKNNRFIYGILNWGQPGIVAKLAPLLVVPVALLVSVLFWAAVRVRNRTHKHHLSVVPAEEA